VPSRKQRRRRAKERRHEYEYVYVDEEGNEVDAAEVDVQGSRNGKRDSAAPRKSGQARRGPVVQPPSWSRVGKRGLIFAPIMFVTVMLIGGQLTLPQQIVQTILLLAIFLPFSYVLDSMAYRRYLRRTGQAPR
jgi:Flp pilus assembly protein TadB